MNKTTYIQKIPEYALQPNAISQSFHSASTNAKRLMAMSISLLPKLEINYDFENLRCTNNYQNYKVEFSLAEFTKALGIVEGAKTRLLVEAAAEECSKAILKFVVDHGDFTDAIYYTWFKKVTLNRRKNSKDWNKITLEFSDEVALVMDSYKKAYAKINLLNLGKLQGRYAIRFYELALSYSGFAGKNGNPPGTWYFKHTLDEIRALFQIDTKKYKLTKAFRENIIDKPIKEINDAGIGLRIEPEYIREGKWLVGARFNCRWVKPDEPLPVTPVTETERENEQLRAAFPEEFEKYKAEYIAQKQEQPELEGLKISPDLEELRIEGYADEKLREAHPDFFKTKTTRRKKEKGNH